LRWFDEKEAGRITGDSFMSDTCLTIRAYVPSDWSRLCEIHDSARLDELSLTIGTEAFLTLEQTAEAEGLFDGRLEVAELDGQVVGFVAYTSDELKWLYVAPQAYRRGIGRALVRHAVAQAGLIFVIEVLEGNEPALQLYLSEGFTIRERIEGRLEGNEAFAAAGFVLERRVPKDDGEG
jgi:ribosomal protein S18 acetylase RimI-like enzyme